MAVAKYHILAGFVTFVFFAAAYFVYFNFFNWEPDLLILLGDYKWLTLGLLLALMGSTIADYDLLYKYLNPWHHRSAVTHSALIPTIVFLTQIFPTPLRDYSMLLVSFMLGFASHLFLDLFPSADIEKLISRGKFDEAIKTVGTSFITGITPEELLSKVDLKKLGGTYNIHFPKKILIGRKWRATLSPNLTRLWLIAHGAVALIYSIFLFAWFAPLV